MLIEDVLSVLREVGDPRDFNASHDLGEVLFLTVCGLLCGKRTSVDIAAFAAAHEDEFREVLTLRRGIPSHDTLSRTLRLLDREELEAAVAACLKVMGRTLRKGAVPAEDGEAVRPAEETGEPRMPLVMRGVLDGLARLSLARAGVGAADEAAAARALLSSLPPRKPRRA